MVKFVIIVAIATLAVAQGATLNPNGNTNIVSLLEKEARLLEVPTIGAVIWKTAKVALILIKSAWSVIGFKLGAIALIANLAIWAFKHSFKIVVGAVAMFGFCKLTGKCSLDYVPKGIIEVSDSLVYAARQLENGAALYDTNKIY